MTTRILLELQFSRLFLLSYIINHLTWHAARIYEAMKPESKSQAGRRSRSIRLLLGGVCRAAAQNRLKTHTVTTPLCSYHAVPCFKLQDLTMTMIKPSLNTIIASALLIPNSPLVPINLSKVKDWELMGHKNVVSTCKRASHDAYLWHTEKQQVFTVLLIKI